MDHSMYRLAKDTRDWSSNGLRNGNNRWVKNQELAMAVIGTLKNEMPEIK